MRLGRLAPESAERVLDGACDVAVGEDRARVLREAIGNPLALVELADAVAASDGEDIASHSIRRVGQPSPSALSGPSPRG